MIKARVYIRVSTAEQETARQDALIETVQKQGGIIAGIYREKISGAAESRPELERMIAELEPGDIVVCERIDRLSRLPLPAAEKLIARIREKRAKIAVPGIVDFDELIAVSEGVTKIVLESVQSMLLKIALQAAREDYETRRERQRQGIAVAKKAHKYRGRQPDMKLYNDIIMLKEKGIGSVKTAELLKCSVKTVYRAVKRHGQIKPAEV